MTNELNLRTIKILTVMHMLEKFPFEKEIRSLAIQHVVVCVWARNRECAIDFFL